MFQIRQHVGESIEPRAELDNSKLCNREQTPADTAGSLLFGNSSGEPVNNMKTLLIAVCFAVALLTFRVASAQDTTNHDDMKAEDSKNEVQVTGTVSETGKTFVSEMDGKSWTILNPDAVKGHEGHHVILIANFDADKKEARVVSLKMAK